MQCNVKSGGHGVKRALVNCVQCCTDCPFTIFFTSTFLIQESWRGWRLEADFGPSNTLEILKCFIRALQLYNEYVTLVFFSYLCKNFLTRPVEGRQIKLIGREINASCSDCRPISSMKFVNIPTMVRGGSCCNAWAGWNGNCVGRTSNLNYSF